MRCRQRVEGPFNGTLYGLWHMCASGAFGQTGVPARFSPEGTYGAVRVSLGARMLATVINRRRPWSNRFQRSATTGRGQT